MTDTTERLDAIDHVAISVTDLSAALEWYTSQFKCKIEYHDETWAFLKFDNIKLALVVPQQHPPHVAFLSSAAERHGKLKTHRDGTRSIYIKDPSGNSIEVVADDAVKSGG